MLLLFLLFLFCPEFIIFSNQVVHAEKVDNQTSQRRIGRIHVESDYSFALAYANEQGSALMHYDGTPKPYEVYPLNNAGELLLSVKVKAGGATWAVIE